ncbi:MAG: c-type cytochrome [Gammaproteobacteria bacterium]|nr:c-type cytochrome [Gammaproteobacteria bacterium]
MNSKHFVQTLIFLAALSFIASASPVLAAEKSKDKPSPMDIKVSQHTKRPAETRQNIALGKRIYQNACIYCHGEKGDGKGAVAYFLGRDSGPHPRDFTYGVYKFRSTVSGDLPTDDDLFRTVTNGVAGFMPGFQGLSPRDRWLVIYYIKSFASEFTNAKPEMIKVVGTPIPATSASIQQGYRTYQQFKCWECHGDGGLGDGKKAPDLVDDWNLRLPPQNLTMPSAFKNGQRPEDLYRTIMGGLDGGAMPSYSDFLEGNEQNAWHMVNYILSLSRQRQ